MSSLCAGGCRDYVKIPAEPELEAMIHLMMDPNPAARPTATWLLAHPKVSEIATNDSVRPRFGRKLALSFDQPSAVAATSASGRASPLAFEFGRTRSCEFAIQPVHLTCAALLSWWRCCVQSRRRCRWKRWMPATQPCQALPQWIRSLQRSRSTRLASRQASPDRTSPLCWALLLGPAAPG